jgi:hypothetical protein
MIQQGYYLEEVKEKGRTKTVAVPIGYPYGTIPRLILAWLATEAVRTKSRELELGKTLTEFMNDLGITSQTGGKNGSITRLRDQMKRLFSSSVAIVTDGGVGQGSAEYTRVAEGHDMWWDPLNPNQAGLWQSRVKLSENFFNELIESPVPIDLRALKALKHSPIALDLYSWLTYRNFSLRQPTIVSWDKLYSQFGSESNRVRKFRENVTKALTQVLTVYPANVTPEAEGLLLKPSLTSVPRLVRD